MTTEVLTEGSRRDAGSTLSKRLQKLVAIQPPPITTHGQVYRFQIFFRQVFAGINGADGTNGTYPRELSLPQSIFVVAETQGQAIYLVREMGLDIEVSSAGPGVPVLDPAQEIFGRDSAAAFLGYETSGIDTMMADGRLPKARDGKPRFTRRMLLATVDKAA